MSDTPPNTITLQEAFSIFRDWYERDDSELSSSPLVSYPDLELPPKDDKRAYNKAVKRAERASEPARKWWKEVDERDLKAQSAFKAYLETGGLEFTVYDRNTGREFRITAKEWRDQKLNFGGLLSPFSSDVISLPTGDPLAHHNGLTPYTDKKQFYAWFDPLRGREEPLTAQSKDAPKFQNTVSALREKYPPNGVPPRGQKHQTTHSIINDCLSNKDQPPVSLETLRRALTELKLVKSPQD